jgi:hypothetical protein
MTQSHPGHEMGALDLGVGEPALISPGELVLGFSSTVLCTVQCRFRRKTPGRAQHSVLWSQGPCGLAPCDRPILPIEVK